MNRNLRDLLQDAAAQSTFTVQGQTGYTAGQIREMYRSSTDSSDAAVVFAQPQIPAHLLSDLAGLLSVTLKPFMAEGYVGYGPASLMTGRLPSVSELCRVLVRASAILGPVETEETLMGWVEGKPLAYSETIILNGVFVERPFRLNEISFSMLSNSAKEPPVYLGVKRISPRRTYDISGCVKVSVQIQPEEPALYMPEPPYNEITVTASNLALNSSLLRSMCEEISLARNHYVDWTVTWPEYGDLAVFNNGLGALHAWHDVDTRPKTELTQPHFLSSLILNSKRDLNKDNGNLDLAISRWHKSKNTAQNSRDSLIDVRVALESLYLDGVNAELGFRLAVRGAWYLGSDVGHRRQYFQLIQRAYRQASLAVHGGKVPNDEDSSTLLKAAQDFCRESILKRLDEGEEPDWDEIILGEG